MQRKNLASRMGGWSAHHRWLALGLWFAFVIAAIAGGAISGQINLKESQLGDGESGHAARVIDNAGFEDRAGEMILITYPGHTVSDPAFRTAVDQAVDRVSTFPQVTNVRSPLATSNAGQVTKDGSSALVQFDITGDPEKAADKIQPVMNAVAGLQHAHPEMHIAEFGQASAAHVLNDKINGDLNHARNVSLPLTLVILLFAFGAAVAAGIPVLLAFSAVLATFGLNSIVSHVMPTTDVTAEIILMIGMAVGVDYSLFYLRRERDERAATRTADRSRVKAAKVALRQAKKAGDAAVIASAKGTLRDAKRTAAANRHSALDIAASTSGQAVLISGVTVFVAMAGMLLAGDPTFVAIGIAAMAVVFVAVIGSLTGLPAILSLLGDKVERGRIPFLGRLTSRQDRTESRFWGAIIDRVLRRPAVSAGIAAVGLAALAIPAFSINTQTPSFKFLPQDLAIVKTYKQIEQKFPGGPAPAVIAFQANDVTSPEAKAAIAEFKQQGLKSGEIGNPIEVTVNPDHTVARITAPLAGDGENAKSEHALSTLRNSLIPTTLDHVGGSDVSVTGDTAGSHDFNELMKVRTPIVFAFVLGMAFLLLLVTFHSIVIPIKAIVLNLLSVGAAYGILVAIFQWGWGESILGFHSTGSIANWLPLFLFVVLFGLSMDYHVFILSRVKELVDGGMSTEDAVSTGIKGTAGVVTSAAIVMVGVFGLFATLSVLDIKQFGVGAAVAVLLDATVIRAVLLPATMKLLGDWNWYMPKSLQWLPTLQHSPEPTPAEA
ncbi:MAG TPA: MMPL family transporter [Gaiellales bacterium]|jgi:RND superfamily putative drug exporter